MRYVLIGAVALTWGLAACSGGGGGAVASPSPGSPVVLGTPDIAAMNAREATQPNLSFDVGHTIQIKSDGFHPRSLASSCCDPVVFKNLTDGDVTVVFENKSFAPAVVPAHGGWSLTPKNQESLAFHVSSDPATKGTLQVEAE